MHLCAKMTQWAGGGALEYPPLPTIEGVGTVPYHSVCDFQWRPPHLWPPSALRQWLQVRGIHAQAENKMEAYFNEETGDFVDGLADMVTDILAAPLAEQPKPLSVAQAAEFGQIDPLMWVAEADETLVLTLEGNMREVNGDGGQSAGE